MSKRDDDFDCAADEAEEARQRLVARVVRTAVDTCALHGLTATELRVLLAMVCEADEMGIVTSSVKGIGRKIGTSRRAARAAIRKLEQQVLVYPMIIGGGKIRAGSWQVVDCQPYPMPEPQSPIGPPAESIDYRHRYRPPVILTRDPFPADAYARPMSGYGAFVSIWLSECNAAGAGRSQQGYSEKIVARWHAVARFFGSARYRLTVGRHVVRTFFRSRDYPDKSPAAFLQRLQGLVNTAEVGLVEPLLFDAPQSKATSKRRSTKG